MTKRFTHLAAIIAMIAASLPSSTAMAAVASGTLVKSPEQSAVYYVSGGKRYAFPNDKVFFTWYSDFSSVITISPAELANLPLSGNVVYKPGVKLVKITTDPRVFAVARYGILHWITSESVASALYGSTWNKQVDDIPDTFFTNYTVSEPITKASDYDKALELGIGTIQLNLGVAVPLEPGGGTGSDTTTQTGVPMIGGCAIFPADSAWNTPVTNLPVRSDSATFIASIGSNAPLHPDVGGDGEYGIPFTIVPGTQANVPITYTAWGDESDPGPFPIPANATVENGTDKHVLVLQRATCMLYELGNASKDASGPGWSADAGAKWDLSSNAHRPFGWTSADAAGLPILPGLVRYDEVAAGAVNHAIRFTAPSTQKGYILPATHFAGSNNASLPPMGLRVRLKANYDISGLTGQAKVIATAMKKYGMILADNGSPWFFQGASDTRWNDDDLNQLKGIPGSAFEAVDTGAILNASS
jgi:hypothetical protein